MNQEQAVAQRGHELIPFGAIDPALRSTCGAIFRSSLGDGRPKQITTDAVPMQKAPAPLFQMTSAAKPPAMLEMQAPCRTLADLCESFFRQVASTLALCSRTSGHRFHLLFPLAVGCRLCHLGRQQFCCPSIRSSR